MGLASGAKTVKMKFGHHGANHPVRIGERTVVITSQNHGFAVDPDTLPANLKPTHVVAVDGSLQGSARTDRPAFCFQGIPKRARGRHDIGISSIASATLMDERSVPKRTDIRSVSSSGGPIVIGRSVRVRLFVRRPARRCAPRATR